MEFFSEAVGFCREQGLCFLFCVLPHRSRGSSPEALCHACAPALSFPCPLAAETPLCHITRERAVAQHPDSPVTPRDLTFQTPAELWIFVSFRVTGLTGLDTRKVTPFICSLTFICLS